MTDLSSFKTGFANIVESLIWSDRYGRESDTLLKQGISSLLGPLVQDKVLTIEEFRELKEKFYSTVQSYKEVEKKRVAGFEEVE